MYQCVIEYTGNSNALQNAFIGTITINGEDYAVNTRIYALGVIELKMTQALGFYDITAALITVSSNNSGQVANITTNNGGIKVYIYVFYPTSDFTGILTATINGLSQTFTFEKIATA